MRTFTQNEYELIETLGDEALYPLGDAIVLGLVEKIATDTYRWR